MNIYSLRYVILSVIVLCSLLYIAIFVCAPNVGGKTLENVCPEQCFLTPCKNTKFLPFGEADGPCTCTIPISINYSLEYCLPFVKSKENGFFLFMMFLSMAFAVPSFMMLIVALVDAPEVEQKDAMESKRIRERLERNETKVK
jgi:hypothetical protein